MLRQGGRDPTVAAVVNSMLGRSALHALLCPPRLLSRLVNVGAWAGTRALARVAAGEAPLVLAADECAAAERLISVQVTRTVLRAALAVLACEWGEGGERAG